MKCTTVMLREELWIEAKVGRALRPAVVFLLAVVAAGSCAGDRTTRIPTRTQLSPPEHVLATNYQAGKRLSAAVGETILFDKDYTISATEIGVRPSADLSLDADAEDLHVVLSASRTYPVCGTWTHGGIDYRLIEVQVVFDPYHPDAEPATFLLPITKDGQPHNVVTRTDQRIRVQISPEGVLLRPDLIERTDPSKGFVDYDYLYSGTNGRTFTMTYREYSRDNLLTPEYSRDLIYPNSSEPIFLNTDIKLRIHEITSERIVYSLEPS